MNKQYELKQLKPEQVPENMMVNCPKVGTMLRPMRKCFTDATDQKPDGSIGCHHCLGAIEVAAQVMDISQQPPFFQRYRLVCVHPVMRQITPLSEV